MRFLQLSLLILIHSHVLSQDRIVTGAAQVDGYLPIIEGRSVGLVVNHTSLVGRTHLVDTLSSLGVEIKRIFAPEHGFRGDHSDGEKIRNSRDKKTGLPVVSLYGKSYKPTDRQLADLDFVVFDIQDVGVRCYTYVSTLHYVLEASAEQGVKVIVLDRPNPNAHFVDGPVLDSAFSSFVGLHPIPLVYGMTIGELASMINDEGWLANGQKCDLTIINLKNYTHQTEVSLDVKPSPNLPDMGAIGWYPSLVLFEGTIISVGRGTYQPFRMVGHPYPAFGDFQFTPQAIPAMSTNPPYEGEVCYGLDLRPVSPPDSLALEYLVDFHQKAKNPNFFNSYFKLLAGTDQLEKDIKSGLSASEIREKWKSQIETFQALRGKYLLYP